MLRKDYEVLKNDNRNGDFVNIVQKDLNETKIELTEDYIKKIPKTQWKKYVNLKIEVAALKYLSPQINEKTKTKHIQFSFLQMSDSWHQRKPLSVCLFLCLFV